jgi:hypothetical protein
MAAGDRDRRAQLMRYVVEELLLAGDDRRALGGLALERACRLLVAPSVPDHRQEHERHQRHLEQFPPLLAARACVVEYQQPGDDAEHEQHSVGRLQRPDAEAVEHGEAGPDEVEWDRLPARPLRHGGEVQERERDPREIERAKPT